MTAMTADNAINTTSMIRIVRTCFFSDIFGAIDALIKSIVSVELEVRTNEDKVDIEADNTRITTNPINTSGRFSSRCGMIASNPSVATSVSVRRPKPPRK